MSETTTPSVPWWRGAVVYQIYIRSFCDSNGDGQGDLPGVMAKLDHLAKLGVDAIWLSPIHPSPNRDWGYDVADYEGVHRDYGTLDDFKALVDRAHASGIRVLLDEVLAHTSDEHAWFRESLAGKDKADWYVWADPKPDGTAPNNWLSAFGGPAWAYQPARRKYYHHKFLRQQPKLNWRNADAARAALRVLATWLERGADGFRLDVANAYLHDASLTDNPAIPLDERSRLHWAHAPNMQRHFHDSNLPENAAVLDAIRKTVERFDGRFVFGEFSEEPERSGCYLAPETGLHAGYTFNLLEARALTPALIRDHYAVLARHPDHWPVISFSNHDVTRTVSRFGSADAGPAFAKLALALLLTLKGTIQLYQGEELGLTETELARDQLRDPVGDLYYPVHKGRDGCRTPMPWNAEQANFGFSRATPWLPLAPEHGALSVASQESDPDSPLALACKLIAMRRESPALRLGEIAFLDAPDHVLVFERSHGDDAKRCVFNLDREKPARIALNEYVVDLEPLDFVIL